MKKGTFGLEKWLQLTTIEHKETFLCLEIESLRDKEYFYKAWPARHLYYPKREGKEIGWNLNSNYVKY